MEAPIGKYAVVRPLGRGGMGEVLEVVDSTTGQHLALKRFASKGSHAEFLRKRFIAEGRLLARLDHKGLVKVHDIAIDSETDTPYFTMDLVLAASGSPCTLEDERRAMPPDETRLAAIYGELREALLYLHAAGIVHRDIKLENVLVSADGSLRLSDFGISRILDDRLRHELVVTTTMTGDHAPVMGSAAYFAPELREGRPATTASDIWSLGVLVFRLLTGVWYEPGTAVEELLSGFDPVWRELLDHLLARDPAKRSMPPFTDCVREVRRRSRRRGVIVVGALCGLATLVALSVQVVRGMNPETPRFVARGETAVLSLGRNGAIDFVQCPTGRVDMALDWRDGTTTPVTITRPYWIMKYPLTRRESALFPPLDPPPGVVDEKTFRNYVCLNRVQAEGLCGYFTQHFAEALPEGYEIRLPTLAEWEHAFHAGVYDQNDPFGDLLRIHRQDEVYEAIYHDYDRGDEPRTKRLNAWGIGDWCGKEKVWDALDPADLKAPDRERNPNFFQVQRLPQPTGTVDFAYASDVTNRVNLIRMPNWARWEASAHDCAEDWCPIRLVIGPKR